MSVDLGVVFVKLVKRRWFVIKRAAAGFLNAYRREFGLGTAEGVMNSWQAGLDDAVRARVAWTVWTPSVVGPY